MAVCVHEAGFDPALKNCLHAAPWSLSESLTGSDEWDVLRAVINFPPPCYEHIDLCSMWSALESAVAARSRHWAPGAVAKETKNRADKCLKRFWERKSSFAVCFTTNLNHTDATLTVEIDVLTLITRTLIQKHLLKHENDLFRPFVPCLCSVFCRSERCDGGGCPVCQNVTVTVSRSNRGKLMTRVMMMMKAGRKGSSTYKGRWVAPRWIYFASVASKNEHIMNPFKSITTLAVFSRSAIKPIKHI